MIKSTKPSANCSFFSIFELNKKKQQQIKCISGFQFVCEWLWHASVWNINHELLEIEWRALAWNTRFTLRYSFNFEFQFQLGRWHLEAELEAPIRASLQKCYIHFRNHNKNTNTDFSTYAAAEREREREIRFPVVCSQYSVHYSFNKVFSEKCTQSDKCRPVVHLSFVNCQPNGSHANTNLIYWQTAIVRFHLILFVYNWTLIGIRAVLICIKCTAQWTIWNAQT